MEANKLNKTDRLKTIKVLKAEYRAYRAYMNSDYTFPETMLIEMFMAHNAKQSGDAFLAAKFFTADVREGCNA